MRVRCRLPSVRMDRRSAGLTDERGSGCDQRPGTRQGSGCSAGPSASEPGMFASASRGSVVFGLLTIATAFVVGRGGRRASSCRRSSGGSVAPARCARRGRVILAPSASARSSASSAAGSAPAPCSSACRRRYRRAVTRRYLELPLSWHHRHPTGTLLSNANADVESAWYPIAPLPFAVGTVVMLVAAIAALFAHRLGAGAGRRSRSSRRCSASTSSTPAGWRPARRRRPAAAGRGAARSRTRASTARSWSRPWAARPTRPSGSPPKAGELRDAADPGRPGARAVRPGPRRAAQLGTLAVLAGRRAGGCGRARSTVDRRGERRVPVHGAGVPGAGDRLGARRAAAQRRRVGAGRGGVLDGDRRHALRRADARPAATGRRRCASTTSTSPTRERPAGAARGDVRGAGRAHGRAGRPDRLAASRRSPRSPPGWSTRTPARVGLDGVDAARAQPRRRWPARSRWCRRCRSCSTTPCAATSRSTGDGSRRRRGVAGAAAGAGRRRSSARCRDGLDTDGRRARHVAVGRAAAAAHAGPGARRRAPAAGARRRDQRRRPARGGGDPAALRPATPARRSWSWRTGGPRSRWPTRWSTSSTAGGGPRHPRRAAGRRCPGTPTWSPPTSRPTPSGSASRRTTSDA